MSKYFVPTARPAGYRAARRAGHGYGETARPDWRGIDWAAHMHTAEIDGTPVNYVDIGSGEREPIVFVHGLGGQWQNWLENIPRAAEERRVVALDLPGFGLSPMPRERITISGYGRVVDALCERLGLGRVDVVGNSMGGYIAAEVAIQFPQRVDQLLLVSAAGITSANIAHAPILTLGRIATALVTWSAAPRPADRGAAAVAPHGAAAGGPPPVAAQGGPRLRGLLQGRPASRASRTRCAPASTTTSATGCPRSACRR